MKFSQMEYKRPDFEKTYAKYEDLLANFKAAKTADECFAAYKEINDFDVILESMFELATIRKSLNTKDELYAAEDEYLEEIEPELEEVAQEISRALLESPFRKEMEDAWGKQMFTNLEMEMKTFAPEVIDDLQEENELSSQWADMMASAVIVFDGKEHNFPEMEVYRQSLDREVRKRAAHACSDWFIERSEQFDNIFDALVKVRTRIARKLGYENFIELGYHRMQRSYDQDMVAKLREDILKYFVPITTKLRDEQAKRIGVPSITAIDGISYPDGNPTPKGTPEEIFAHCKKMYEALSGEAADFINFMLENELMDVLTRPNKEVIGYMTYIPMHKAPFIFANFNGTSQDIYILTHEAGHGYAAYVTNVAKDTYPHQLMSWPEDICEIHGMAMEFLAWPWMEGFFGEGTKKYYHSHLSTTVRTMSYSAMADEFQHLVYASPEMTPTERNALWLSLHEKYRPYDMADIPYLEQGRSWHADDHIFECPFLYIDYCVAGVVALHFWVLSQKDFNVAWEKYNQLIQFGGTKTLVDLLAACDLPNPFEPGNLQRAADEALKWFEANSDLKYM